ncbi:S1C family serine protease [Planomicrobium sp. CPCC 101110]|uniref:S1C family serine protease n=1 Tax=Planomicrobium sp. CPCC 101110 TaxID=2599619 RepID=UPI0011B7C00A|nr:trypsin-like peptidase domain-containing protein [Planomicrobium sp. CPCC 101110]TWT27438.1 PDZ domain-containing protein [Planomicrobium sp. CPCC 101110]
MGYYNTPEPKTKQKGYFASSFTGLIAGALLVGVVLPGFTDSDAAVQENTTAAVESASNIQNVSSVVTTDVTKIVDKNSAAVVGVTNMQTAAQNPFAPSAQTESQEAGTGSGVIYKQEGGSAYIVTNNHVVDGAEEVKVTLSDGTELEAEVLGADIWTDLAVLKVAGDSITAVAEFGDSSVLKPGEPVVAIGNPLGLQFSGSVTTGVVSGTERAVPIDINEDGTEDWESEVIQTDAAINPGNSGGALINSQGQVIGINSMKIAQDAVEGIGLAIPINAAVPIIEDLEKNGEVERPSMGVSIIDLMEVPAQSRQNQLNLPEDIEGGIVVQSVSPGSGAENAGLQAYDVIVEMDGEAINTVLDLRQYLYNETKVGDTVAVKIYRNGKTENLEVELAESL